jgi:hypothetical protein
MQQSCAFIGQSVSPISNPWGVIAKCNQLASEILFSFAQNGRVIEHQKWVTGVRGGRGWWQIGENFCPISTLMGNKP